MSDLIHGMSFDDYRAIPAVNWSSLKHMAASAKHYRHALTNDRPDTPAMEMGRAAHCAVVGDHAEERAYALADMVCMAMDAQYSKTGERALTIGGIFTITWTEES